MRCLRSLNASCIILLSEQNTYNYRWVFKAQENFHLHNVKCFATCCWSFVAFELFDSPLWRGDNWDLVIITNFLHGNLGVLLLGQAGALSLSVLKLNCMPNVHALIVVVKILSQHKNRHLLSVLEKMK